MQMDHVFWWRDKESTDSILNNEYQVEQKVYDKYGFDQYGFDEEGFDRDGFDLHGINRWGFDKYGDDARFPFRDKDGFDREGYDQEGYDRDGYDKKGRNKADYDEEGYDIIGYDRDGYDRDGYDRDGYDRNGYDRDGFDRDGYNIDGRNKADFVSDVELDYDNSYEIMQYYLERRYCDDPEAEAEWEEQKRAAEEYNRRMDYEEWQEILDSRTYEMYEHNVYGYDEDDELNEYGQSLYEDDPYEDDPTESIEDDEYYGYTPFAETLEDSRFDMIVDEDLPF